MTEADNHEVVPTMENLKSEPTENDVNKYSTLVKDSPATAIAPQDQEPKQINIVEGEEVVVKKEEAELEEPTGLFGAVMMLTNLCLASSIFSFASRAKHFGLVWLLVATFICGAANYWTIVRACEAANDLDVCDYSEVTEKLLGPTAKLWLNIFIWVYSYALLMSFISLLHPLIGRFIQGMFLYKRYDTYDEYKEKVWKKAYIKFPMAFGLSAIIATVSLLRDMSALNFSGYLGVGSITYVAIVAIVECPSYYKHFRDHKYDKNNKSTHPNWVDIGKAFTSKLEFFKSMAALFCAFSCHTGIFPVFQRFKGKKNGLQTMKKAVFYSCVLTAVLHVAAITTCFLIEPIDPEDLIIYRIPKKIPSRDVAMNLGKIAIFLSLFFTSPGYYFGIRCSIANHFTKGVISDKFNFILTYASFLICAFIGAVYDKILNYFNYVGGFFATPICYIYPILLWIAHTKKPITYWMNMLEFIGALILTVIGVIAGIRTILDDANVD